jgi:pimeloyl-ACP methyl ester carboxylesterase
MAHLLPGSTAVPGRVFPLDDSYNLSMDRSQTPIAPFMPLVDADAVSDLHSRLAAARWADAPSGIGWEAGADVAYLRELADYWLHDFDWAAALERFTRFLQLRVELDGVGIHVIHARGVSEGDGAPAPMPLLLNHGWPDSAWRYTKVIPLLTDPGAHGADPADAFDVVVPEMPGYGWSDAPKGGPLNSIEVAGLWARLMTALGYRDFATAGGDIGSHVSRYLSLDHPDRVIASHRTDAGMPRYAGDLADLTQEERDWLADGAAWFAAEGAYANMHRTKPQTIATALTDSPIGLAAWIVEKLHSWSDCHGDIESVYTKDEILTLMTQYWMTGTIGSSMRMYRANAAIDPAQLSRRVEVPSGFSLFPGDILTPPRAWLDRTANTTWVSTPERGGHFAPFEQPEIYAQELREFFRPYR